MNKQELMYWLDSNGFTLLFNEHGIASAIGVNKHSNDLTIPSESKNKFDLIWTITKEEWLNRTNDLQTIDREPVNGC